MAERYQARDITELSSLRLTGRIEEKLMLGSQWSLVGSVRAWSDAAFALRPERYPVTHSQKDSGEITLRDLYLQFRRGGFLFRAGNQQVVWGDAFGFFYSDIINPKDFRDGLFGDFAEIRAPIPMVNLRYTMGSVTAQAVWVMAPSFNLVPLPGSDFAYPFSSSMPGWSTEITRETGLPMTLANSEPGGRLNLSLDGFDLSAFYFNYTDRQPYYSLASISFSPQTLYLQEKHARLESFGLTGTIDPGAGYVLRFEGLIHKDRTFPTLIGTALSTLRSDELIYVVGLDFPSVNKWTLGMQWSESRLSRPDTNGLLRSAQQSLASVRVSKGLGRDVNATLTYSLAVNDLGQQIALDLMAPLSGQVEATLGTDMMLGPPSSDFGRIGSASRFYLLFRSYFRS